MTTPILKQWQECKEQHPDKLILFRVGDFIEAFGKDAETLAKELDLSLTLQRNWTKAESGHSIRETTKMTGFPAKSLETNLKALLAKGFKVALCEEVKG